MNMTSVTFSNGWPLLCWVLLAACDSQAGEEADGGVVQSAIVGGHELSMSESEQSGIVMIVDRNSGTATCTATLLNDHWLITAGHCFNGAEAQSDGTISPYYREKYAFHFGNKTVSGDGESFNPTSRLASMILKHPGSGFGLDGLGFPIGFDIVLVKLAAPAPSWALPAASYPSGRLRIYGGNNQSTVGKTLTAYGYGKNQGLAGVGPWDSIGILRYGWLDVYGASYWSNWLESPQGTGQYLTNNGDSGGPSFLDTYASNGTMTRELVGVHRVSSGDAGESSAAGDTHAEFFSDFIRTAIDEGQHPLEPGVGAGYKARLQHSRKCLDVSGGSTQSGAAVVQWTCHGNPNQRVTLIEKGNGYYSAQFAHSQQCMEVKDGSTSNSAPIVQRPCNGSDRQLLKLESWRSDWENLWPMSGRSRIRWKHSSKCADLAGANTSNGSALVQYTCHVNPNQQIQLLK